MAARGHLGVVDVICWRPSSTSSSARTALGAALADGARVRFAGPLPIDCLQMLDPAIQAPVSLHQFMPNSPHFVHAHIMAHEVLLRTVCPELVLGIDSGETS